MPSGMNIKENAQNYSKVPENCAPLLNVSAGVSHEKNKERKNQCINLRTILQHIDVGH